MILKELSDLVICPGNLIFTEFLKLCKKYNFNKIKISDRMSDPQLWSDREQFEGEMLCGSCYCIEVCYAPAGCKHEREINGVSYALCKDCLINAVKNDDEIPLVRCIQASQENGKTTRCENTYSCFQIIACLESSLEENPENQEILDKYKSSLVKYFIDKDCI